MKPALLLACIVALSLIATVVGQASKYENYDIEILLRNDRILNNFIKCLTDRGPCTNDGREIKKYLPQALATSCSKCSYKQKLNTKKLILHLETKKPAQFREIQAKYDPTGNHLRQFKALPI